MEHGLKKEDLRYTKIITIHWKMAIRVRILKLVLLGLKHKTTYFIQQYVTICPPYAHALSDDTVKYDNDLVGNVPVLIN